MVMVTDPQRYARRMIRARTMSSATLNGVAPVAAAQRSTPRVMRRNWPAGRGYRETGTGPAVRPRTPRRLATDRNSS